MSDEDMSDERLEEIVLAALGELLNIAGAVAELQTSDEAAEEIYAITDLLAAYYGITRNIAVTEEQEDGSIITRFQEQPPGEIKMETAQEIKPKGHISLNSNKYRFRSDTDE
jgi:hypothetical protein